MLSFLFDLAGNPKVKAWGEIGLDFNRMYSPKKDQEKWFIRQIACADELNLPVIFHERDTNGRFLEIIKTHPRKPPKGVIHCFSGDASELKAYIELGYSIGITGIVTMNQRGATLRKQVPSVPLEHLVIETDAPYLTPVPQNNRTRRNEPAFVRSVFFKLSEIRGEDPEALSDAIWENTCRLFDIDNDSI
jgi:TatD DNase family protein